MEDLQNAFQKKMFYAAYIVAIVEELLRHTVLSEYALKKAAWSENDETAKEALKLAVPTFKAPEEVNSCVGEEKQ